MTMLLADLLGDLRQDHRNMSVMLDLLSQQVEHIRNGERPDYELIYDIMRYMTTYSDAVHHPKEDMLYSVMLTEQPELVAGLERVGPEHMEIAERGDTLRHDVEAVASGAAITRERVIEDTSNYVQFLRQHMAWEEEDLFRRADKLAGREEDLFIDISNFDRLDPVFGPQREHSFENLLRNIRNLSAT
jgi:hemerythrin-like domain-containing protein